MRPENFAEVLEVFSLLASFEHELDFRRFQI